MSGITRKSFLLGVISAGISLQWSPIRSVIASHSISMMEDVSNLQSATEYIQDGLVAMYDGIENVGYQTMLNEHRQN